MSEVTQQQVEEILGQIATLSKENQELKAQVSKLSSTGAVEAAQQEGPKIPEDTFTVGGKKYKFTVPKFLHPEKGEMTALEALTDRTLLASLVKKESSILEEVD
jgi:hypothetical protein